MAPKKSKKTKASLKKTGTMTATAAAGQEFLRKAWGVAKLNQVNALLEERDSPDTKDSSDASSSSPEVATLSSTSTSAKETKTKAKPKLSKARTMKSTAREAKTLIGSEVLGDTRSETKRRQAAVNAKKALQEVSNPSGSRKASLKRLGTMAATAKEGNAYVKRLERTNKKRSKGGAKKRTK